MLVSEGPDALKAERLARTLGTTKGSFYWHFKDVPDFHRRMLTHWESKALKDVIDEIEREDSPVSSLRKLALMSSSGADDAHGGVAAEPAIRAWARSNATVANALAEIDAARLKYLQALMSNCGVSNPDLARALYAASIGMEELSARSGKDNREAMGTLVDLILALR